MAIGFRQRDPSGNILVDITTRLPRIMGRVNLTATVNGSVSVPASGTNPLFYWFSPSDVSSAFNAAPNITDDGNTISWQYIGVASYQKSGVLTYGRY